MHKSADPGEGHALSHDAGRMLMRDMPDMIVLTYLKHIEDAEDDNEAVVRVISKKEGVEKEDAPQGGRPIHGIYGAIELDRALYLIYIKEARQIGEIKGKKVYEVQKAGAVHVSGGSGGDAELARLTGLLDAFFKIPGLLFSDEPLSEIGMPPSRAGPSVGLNSDFVFNFLPYSRFVQKYPEAGIFGVQTIQGFFGRISLEIGRPVEYTLISRRCWRNAGTRYHTRGADRNGHAANTVETAYLMETPEKDESFLQVRGSVPVIWEQRINLAYKPPVTLGTAEEGKIALANHIALLKRRYGKEVAILNLLDERGHEANLNYFFRKELADVGVESVSMDYHKVAKGGKAERLRFYKKLSALIDRDFLIRTNCIDCIDRTNVAQLHVAKMKMYKQLTGERGGVKDVDLLMEDFDARRLAQLWNYNANSLSLQYTGTSALKTDVAEHGVRTLGGMIKDAISSGRRYVHNNFTDGKIQDVIEIMTGVRNTMGNCSRGGGVAIHFVLLLLVAGAGIYALQSGRCWQARSKLLLYLATAAVGLALILMLFKRSLSFPSPKQAAAPKQLLQ